MSELRESASPEDRREFFKTLGRNLALGATGAGVWLMFRSGKISTCVNELGPCNTCVELKKGCELPKAVAHRRQESNGRS